MPSTPLDYAAAAMRACYACGRAYAADVVQRDPAWQPTRNGWRCGDCSRAWASRQRACPCADRRSAAALGAGHAHADARRFRRVLECEATLAARELLLARGGLTRAERSEVAATVLMSL